MKKLISWMREISTLLTDVRGIEVEVPVPTKTATPVEPEEELNEKEFSEDDDVNEEEGADDDDDIGNNVGKKRSKFIPRERFDKVNAKAQRLEKLEEAGILIEGEDGELQINPQVIERIKNIKPSENATDNPNFRFNKEEVDDASWPLVQKINKAYDHYDEMAGKLTYALQSLQAENAILRDYPEFLQKEHPLRKKALDILKNDPEFKKTYRHNPERGYWAVKRAAELLAGGKQEKKPVNKSKFIVGRGDAGKETRKMVDMSALSREQLDDLEKKEHERLMGLRRK